MSYGISLYKTSLKGIRPSNEDIEKYFLNLDYRGKPILENLAPIDLFIICDGHGGNEVAEFVADKLLDAFSKTKQYYPLTFSEIKKIYDTVQTLLVNHKNNIAKYCGTTTLVLIRYMEQGKKYVQVINLGDSRAVLSRKGLAIPLTKDHKPSWPDERKRIMEVNLRYNTNKKIHFEAGDWRIGDLSVSRAFGDLDNVPHITHIPEVFKYQLSPDDEFIVLACDGVFDVLQNNDVVNFVRDYLINDTIFLEQEKKNKQIDDNIARRLAEFALHKGSNDNISIMIIIFNK
jgi:serine/threonine protein phosphatase PrpC